MFAEIFLRIFSDCCILFAFLGCCPTVLPYSFPLLAAALICSCCAALAAFLWDKGNITISRLCLFLPLLALLLARDVSEMRILVLPILYTAVTIARGSFHQEYYEYQKFLIRSLALMTAVWAIISAATWIEDPQDLVEDIIVTEVILRYTIVHFVCGIMLQRHLRLGTHSTSKSGAEQMAVILITVGVVAAGFVLSEPMLRQWASKAIWSILTAVISVITILMGLIDFSKIEGTYQEPSQSENTSTEPGNAVGMPTGETVAPTPIESAPPDHTAWIFVVALIAVVIALALMFLAFSRRKRRSGNAVVFAEAAKAQGKKRVPRLSNRAKVRQVYRDFLRQEQKRGLELKKEYTTQDILQRISRNTDKTAAGQLRDVYIRARYDDTREVTKAQADAARAAMKKAENP